MTQQMVMNTQTFNTAVDSPNDTHGETQDFCHIPDTKAALEFLAAWMKVTGTGHVTLVSINPGSGPPCGHCFSSDADAAGQWIADRQDAGDNIYWQPNETPKGFDRKPSKADMVATLCRFADIDPDDGTHPYEAERDRLLKLAAALAKSDTPSTFIIDSGNGMQPLWVVKREALSPDTTARIEDQNAGLAAALGGDSVQNVDRLLRVPGTINYPNAAKRGRGRTVTNARLIHHSERVYSPAQAAALPEKIAATFAGSDLVRAKASAKSSASTASDADIQALMEELEAADTGTLSEELAQRLEAALAVSASLKRRWEGDPSGLYDTSRSGLDASVARLLKGAGFSPFDAALILLTYEHGQRDSAQPYRTVARAVLNTSEPMDGPHTGSVAETFAGIVGAPIAPAPGIDATEAARNDARFVFRDHRDRKNRKPPEMLIEQLLPEVGTSVIFGQSGALKSFVALGMAFATASGGNAFGRYFVFRPGPVIYYAGEGHDGVEGQRLPALFKNAELTDDGSVPIYTVAGVPLVGAPGEADDTIKAIRDHVAKQGIPDPVMIVIDTLARTMPGMNENEAKDAGTYLAVAERLKQEFQCQVVAVGHTGWTDQDRLRGSYAFWAGFDVCILAERDKKSKTVKLTTKKFKDGEDGREFWLKEKEVDLDDGSGFTSLVLEVTEAPNATAQKGSGAISGTEWDRRIILRAQAAKGIVGRENYRLLDDMAKLIAEYLGPYENKAERDEMADNWKRKLKDGSRKPRGTSDLSPFHGCFHNKDISLPGLPSNVKYVWYRGPEMEPWEVAERREAAEQDGSPDGSPELWGSDPSRLSIKG